jgi:hypothetical protein
MTEYTPDNWVIIEIKGIEIKGDDPHYRVLGGWNCRRGVNGDSWRMNSGITGYEYDGDYWYFKGSSGSVYKCYVDSYGLRMNNAHIWEALKYRHGDLVSLVPDQAWIKKDWDWILK